MNYAIARKIENGEKIKLPLGKKIWLSEETQEALETICKEYNVDCGHSLYTLDDTYEQNKNDKLFYVRLVQSIIYGIASVVSSSFIFANLILIIKRIIKKA